MLMSADRSLLVIVDVQDKLYPACQNPEAVIDGCVFLITCAARLGVPVVVSEQYPKGLGRSAGRILDALPAGADVVSKISFSCCGEPAFADVLAAHPGRDQMVVAGMEAHVCVLQSALDLLGAGKQVYVVGDAVTARAPVSIELALGRLAQEGVRVVARESVMFEWLHAAGTPAFKELSALIK